MAANKVWRGEHRNETKMQRDIRLTREVFGIEPPRRHVQMRADSRGFFFIWTPAELSDANAILKVHEGAFC